jgi:hypothetical protein
MLLALMSFLLVEVVAALIAAVAVVEVVLFLKEKLQ